MKRKNPRVDLDKVGNKDYKRIDKMLGNIIDKEKQKDFLNMAIKVYIRTTNKLITKRETDHYMEVIKYCEKLLKGIK